ncbi:MAG: gephyrin-like molybdotransferase Glp [Acidobacteriota bacterium]
MTGTRISRERAVELAVEEIYVPPAEEIDAADANGRVLAADLVARADVPPFDRAQRDGYAVRSADTAGAQEGPVRLRVGATILAGQSEERPLDPETCVRVMTGAAVPPGADAVLMKEEAEEIDAGQIEFRLKLEPDRFIDRAGREVHTGDLLDRVGTRLDPALLGVALSSGAHRVNVVRRPRVAVLGTGSELVRPQDQPGQGQIRASNPWMLAAAIAAAGAEVDCLGIVLDREDELRKGLEAGRGADLLIVSGGTGPGDADLTHRTLEECGAKVLYHGIDMAPGRPSLCARWDKTLVFGLPGTPVAAWVVWRVLVAPVLRFLEGDSSWDLRLGGARLASPLDHPEGREAWFPADLSWKGAERIAHLRTGRGRRSMRDHTGHPALIRIRAAAGGVIPAGSEVEVLMDEANSR